MGTGYTGPHYKILTGIYREILFALIERIKGYLGDSLGDSHYRTLNGVADHNTNCETFSIKELRADVAILQRTKKDKAPPARTIADGKGKGKGGPWGGQQKYY